MRVLKLGLLSSIALVAFGAALTSEVSGQDPRLIGGGPGITVFEDRNFRGDAATYNSNVSNLPSRFNNRISSVRVGPGEQWQICDQANYRGQCVNVSGEESDLGRNDWDNRISSMRRVSGGGGGGWGGGVNQVRPPSWAVGTFYSAWPSVTMTIASNGQVQSNIGGQIYYGRYTNRGIRSDSDGSLAAVSRLGNGIRTYNSSTGQTIDFTRNWSGGGGNNGGWDGPTSAPPSWAVGTFESDNGNIRMTIRSNGQVTSRIGDNTYNGRYYYGSIYSNGEVANVTQDRNGIRTYNRTSGVYLNFRRR
jgi:Beta/Gamma crystallin